MADFLNNLETGLADGTDATAANSTDGGAGFAYTPVKAGGGTVKHSTVLPLRGLRSLAMTATTAGDVARIELTGLISSATVVLDIAFRTPANPSAEVRLVEILGSVYHLRVGLTATGLINVYDASGAAIWTSTTSVNTGSDGWRLGIRCVAATATTGTLELSYYGSKTGTTPTETMPAVTGGNFGIDAHTAIRIGKITSSAAWATFWTDDYQISDSRTALFGAPAGPFSVGITAPTATGSGEAFAPAIYEEVVISGGGPAAGTGEAYPAVVTATMNQEGGVVGNHAPIITTYLSANPCPRAEVLFESFAAGTVKVTVYRSTGLRKYQVRGAVNAAVAGALTRIDFEIPFGVPVSYWAEQFDAGGLSLGETDKTKVTLNCWETWVHNPLDPHGATTVQFRTRAAQSIVRPVEGDVVYPQGRRVGVLVSGQRRGVENVDLTVVTDTIEQVDKLQAMFGDYETSVPPILCIRVGGGDQIRLPRPFFAAVLSASEEQVNYTIGMGEQITTAMSGTEVSPPAPGIFIPLLTNADINSFYLTNAAINSANATNLDVNRQYSLIGAS